MKKVLIGIAAFVALGAMRARFARGMCHTRSEAVSV
ncbi:hypothetical protein BH09CHL1_BH09CHL1_26680 [soil metagenome]